MCCITIWNRYDLCYVFYPRCFKWYSRWLLYFIEWSITVKKERKNSVFLFSSENVQGVTKKSPPPIFPSAAEHGYLALNPCCKETPCSSVLCKCLIDHLEDSDCHDTPDPCFWPNRNSKPEKLMLGVRGHTRIPWPSLCVKLAHGCRNTVQKSENEHLCVFWWTTHHKILFLNDRNVQSKWIEIWCFHCSRLCTPGSPTCGEIIVSNFFPYVSIPISKFSTP